MSTADAVWWVLLVGVTAYAVLAGADFGAGFWSLVAGGGGRGRRARELIDWAIGPVWEANHVWLIFVLVVLWTALLVGVRGDLLDALHPAQPGGAGDRAARRRVRLPQDRAAIQGPGPRRASVRPLVAAHAVLHGHRRRRRRLGQGAGRQRHRRSGQQLAEPALARDRRALRRHVRVPRGRVPGQRRPPRRTPSISSATSAPARWRPASSRARSRSPASSRCGPTRATSMTASPATRSRW